MATTSEVKAGLNDVSTQVRGLRGRAVDALNRLTEKVTAAIAELA